ncbi:MAG: FkbM family methyltransferase [Proteobacteria bacterium]|nr:FkbM family methyltransferase [Pseudomonadota bacterium]MDA0992692.1 FkbM family methyltransferase [Pseudomonadota bacterium]
MAIAAWKRFEKTPGWQRKKRFLKRLTGKELRLKVDLVVPTIKDGGWWFAPEHLDGDSIVYSLGVGDEINFDLSIISKYGVEVFAFDPTPSSINMLDHSALPKRFHFHPWAVTAIDGSLKFYPRLKKDGSKSNVMFTMIPEEGTKHDVIEVPAYSLKSITEKLGHDRIDLLKMDIEGAEYEVLEGLLGSPVLPTQLLVEFHHRFVENGLQRTYDIIDRLRASGYRIFAISEIGREISFIKQ